MTVEQSSRLFNPNTVVKRQQKIDEMSELVCNIACLCTCCFLFGQVEMWRTGQKKMHERKIRSRRLLKRMIEEK